MCFNPYSLGQLLVQQGSISRREAIHAATYQSKNSAEGVEIKFGAICVQFGYCTKKELDKALAEQSKFRIRDYDKGSLQLQALRAEIAAIC